MTDTRKKGISTQRVHELRAQGKKLREIAAELGCSIQSVCYQLRKASPTVPNDTPVIDTQA